MAQMLRVLSVLKKCLLNLTIKLTGKQKRSL